MFDKRKRLELLDKYRTVRSIREAAKLCGISKSTAQRWLNDPSCLDLKQRKPRPASKLPDALLKVRTMLTECPFSTCIEMSRAIGVSKELVRRCVHKLGFSYKKARYYGVAKNGLQLTRKFLLRRDAYIAEGRPIYSVDETGFGRFSYNHSKGWAPCGKQLRVLKNEPRQTSTSVIACSSDVGWIKYTPHKGAVNRLMFCAFLRSMELPQGSVILIDNASIHRGDEVRDACREKGFVLLFVPPYSPWFNPIESCFSIIKRKYPKIQDIPSCFDSLTRQHFESFSRHSLKCYGFDETDSELNKLEMTKPDIQQAIGRKVRAPKRPTVHGSPVKASSTERQRQEDGTILQIKTVTTSSTSVSPSGVITTVENVVKKVRILAKRGRTKRRSSKILLA